MCLRAHAILVLAAATLAACQSPQVLTVTQAVNQGRGPQIDGLAVLPARLLSNNGGGILSPGTSRYGLLSLADEVPLPEALIYLTDAKDEFYRLNGQMISTRTNKKGEYSLRGGIPKGVPVIVNAILNGNRRVVGFTVPDDGRQQVDLSLASNYVTEFLRVKAERDGKSMADYDMAKLPELVKVTRAALDQDALAVPDLEVGHIAAMNRTYALAVGQNTAGLGDAWQTMLGKRVLALVTVAGNGDAGSGGDGQAATQANLYRPRQVVADGQGNLFIADEGNHKIRRVDALTGVITTVAGTGEGGFSGDDGPATSAKLRDPRCIAMDTDGNLYIGDEGNARVRRVDAVTNVITTVVGDPDPDGAGGFTGGHDGDDGPAVDAKIFMARSLAFDPMGHLYIADSQNTPSFNTIRKVDKDGVITTVAGLPGEPGGFSGDGGPAAGARLNYPNQIAFDSAGRLLIADTGNHCIRRVDLTTGIISTVAGIGGQSGSDPDGKLATETRLDAPYGVAAAADGRIFVSERGTGRIRMIGLDGKVATIAGGGTDSADGEATLVQLTQPHDLFVEKDGNLLVADTRGSRVRRILTKFGL